MKTYKIIEKTAGQRNVKTIETNLSLQEAYKELLDLFNRRYRMGIFPVKNWGAAVFVSRNDIDGACKTFTDGTRCFSYDTKSWWIEEEKEEEC